MVVIMLEANLTLTQEGDVCLNVALNPCLPPESQPVFESLGDLAFVLGNPGLKPIEVSGGVFQLVQSP